MVIQYESIVPWGRSYEEYVSMFSLDDESLNKRILGCGDGPAGFNSVMTKKGKMVVSVDPLYRFTKQEIQQRIEETFETVIAQSKSHMEKFRWDRIKDADELGRIRMSAMKVFLEDYEVGKSQNRYVDAELPKLPFEDKEFDLALSSHFLFLYTDHLSYEFHENSVHELMRVSNELRIFPLLDVNGNVSPYVDGLMEKFNNRNTNATIVEVDYEFQKGGNKMMKIINRV